MTKGALKGMALRVRKDLRVLAPYGALGAVGGAVAVHWSPQLAYGILGVVAIFAGVLLFGHEYTHQREGWLFAQPLTRMALWREKVAALLLFDVLLIIATLTAGMACEVLIIHLNPMAYQIRLDPLTSDPVYYYADSDGSSRFRRPAVSCHLCAVRP